MSVTKRAVPIVGGILSGVTIVFTTDSISGALYPIPPDIDPDNKEQVIEYLEKMPASAFVLMLAGYVAASFIAGIVATALAKRYSRIDSPTPVRPAFTAGLLLTVANIVNAIGFPHPFWFIVCNTILHVPAALIGYYLARRKPVGDIY